MVKSDWFININTPSHASLISIHLIYVSQCRMFTIISNCSSIIVANYLDLIRYISFKYIIKCTNTHRHQSIFYIFATLQWSMITYVPIRFHTNRTIEWNQVQLIFSAVALIIYFNKISRLFELNRITRIHWAFSFIEQSPIHILNLGTVIIVHSFTFPSTSIVSICLCIFLTLLNAIVQQHIEKFWYYFCIAVSKRAKWFSILIQNIWLALQSMPKIRIPSRYTF